MFAWEETRAPEPRRNGLHVGVRAGMVRVQHDERRQILVQGTEAVGNPGTNRGFAGDHGAGVDELVGRLVIDGVCVHRTNDAQVIHHLRVPRQQFAHPGAALALLLELEN